MKAYRSLLALCILLIAGSATRAIKHSSLPAASLPIEQLTLTRSGSQVNVWAVESKQNTRIFQQLAAAAGLRQTTLQFRETKSKPLAMYLSATAGSYIVYKYADFVGRDRLIDTLAFTGAIAHEIGHYLNHHEDSWNGPRKVEELELDADYFLGFLLQQLNYTEAQAIAFLDKTAGKAPGYPDKAHRIEVIRYGFRNAARKVSATAFATANPRVIWTDSAWTVQVADSVVATNPADNTEPPWTSYRNRVGIFYDSVNNATYQLNLNVSNYDDYNYGLGRLVNNRTSFTYMKISDRGYNIYNHGKIVFTANCDDPNNNSKLGFDREGVDYLVYCEDDKSHKKKYVLLKDYGYAGLEQLLPAVIISSPNDIGR